MSNEKGASASMLSENFSLEELIRSDTAARLGIDNTPGPPVLKNLYVLAARLEIVRKALEKPLLISSGYRCLELNMQTPGSSSKSAHMLGYAADFHVEGLSPLELCEAVSKIPDLKWDQIILEYGAWCHFSADPQARGQLLTKKSGSPYVDGLVP